LTKINENIFIFINNNLNFKIKKKISEKNVRENCDLFFILVKSKKKI